MGFVSNTVSSLKIGEILIQDFDLIINIAKTSDG